MEKLSRERQLYYLSTPKSLHNFGYTPFNKKRTIFCLSIVYFHTVKPIEKAKFNPYQPTS